MVWFGGWLHFGAGIYPLQSFNTSDPYYNTIIFSTFIDDEFINIQHIIFNTPKYQNDDKIIWHIAYTPNTIEYLGCFGPFDSENQTTWKRKRKQI